jgi:hypothetical protein
MATLVGRRLGPDYDVAFETFPHDPAQPSARRVRSQRKRAALGAALADLSCASSDRSVQELHERSAASAGRANRDAADRADDLLLQRGAAQAASRSGLSSRFRSTDDQKDLDADMQTEAASTPPG